VRIAATAVSFRHVPFAKPLVLSSGPIDGLTEATVRADVETATGVRASGHGSVLLSHPWAYGADGRGAADERDAQMRAMVARLAAGIRGAGGDPLTIGAHLLDAQGDLPLPQLAAAVCAGPVDAAVHDAWARAAGRPAWQLYTRDHVDDLATFLGPDFTGR